MPCQSPAKERARLPCGWKLRKSGTGSTFSFANQGKEYCGLLTRIQPQILTCLLKGKQYLSASDIEPRWVRLSPAASLRLTRKVRRSGGAVGAHLLCAQSLLLVERSWSISTQQKISTKERRCCTAEYKAAVFSDDLNGALREWSGKKLGFFVKWCLLHLGFSDSKPQVACMPQVRLSKLFSFLMLLMTNTPNCFLLSYFPVPPG